MMRTGVRWPAEPVKRVRDADGAMCTECEWVRDRVSPAPWGWRKSQALHEQGTGHRVVMFRYLPAEPDEIEGPAN